MEKRIIVNGRNKPWYQEEIEHDHVLILAFGNALHKDNYHAVATITYARGEDGKQGCLTKGQKVKTVEGMVFNAVVTDKS